MCQRQDLFAVWPKALSRGNFPPLAFHCDFPWLWNFLRCGFFLFTLYSVCASRKLTIIPITRLLLCLYRLHTFYSRQPWSFQSLRFELISSSSKKSNLHFKFHSITRTKYFRFMHNWIVRFPIVLLAQQHSGENQIEIKVLFWIRNWLWIGLAAPRDSKKNTFRFIFIWKNIFRVDRGVATRDHFTFRPKSRRSHVPRRLCPIFQPCFPSPMTTTYALATKNIEYQSFFLRVPQKSARQLNFIQLCLGTTLFLSVFVPRKSIADVFYQISSADTIIDGCKL